MMERNRNWPAWAALILAGLALFVALGGRGNSFSQRWAERDVVAVAPAAPAAPVAPQAMPFDREMQREMYGRGGDNFRFEHGPMAGREGFAMGGPRGWQGHGHGHGFFFGPLAFLFGLSKLIGLGLLAWLLFRMWSNRRSMASATPAPTPPPGPHPPVE
jgi:hypothetical protein